MVRERILKKTFLSIAISAGVIILFFGVFYTYWNTTSAYKTCGSCHEIERSVKSQAMSSHRDLSCRECHGTALSNGFHSLSEKAVMVVTHLKVEKVENIRMDEKELISTMDNCRRCHRSEYALWSSGGHSVDYGHIFLNKKHNAAEQINFDCLRCHGMFFEGNVTQVVEPLDIKGPWKMKDKALASRPAIPCMACHPVHQAGLPALKPDYADPKAIFYHTKDSLSGLGFYDRHEKIVFPVSALPHLTLWEGQHAVRVSDDLLMRNCIQCHAPDALHRAGTSDDRTPRGVHAGLSCMSCHQPHSNSSVNSCKTCHPAISNCKLDVTKMNTSYSDVKSPHNIHFVACIDCHDGVALKKVRLPVD